MHRLTAPALRRSEAPAALFPARLLLLLLDFQALHRLLRPGSQGNRVGHTMLLRLPCHADPPRSRASGNGRSHATGRGRRCAVPNALVVPFARTLAGPARRVRWCDWPCGQNPGRNPEGRQRASSARDDGASANRVHVAGPALLPAPVPEPGPVREGARPEKALDVAMYETCDDFGCEVYAATGIACAGESEGELLHAGSGRRAGRLLEAN